MDIRMKFNRIIMMSFLKILFDPICEASHLTFRFEKLEEQMIVPGLACVSHTLLTRRLDRRRQPLRNIDCQVTQSLPFFALRRLRALVFE
jgi:hypothetical protein